MDRRQFLRGLAAGCVTAAVPAALVRKPGRLFGRYESARFVDWAQKDVELILVEPQSHLLDSLRYMLEVERSIQRITGLPHKLVPDVERARLGLT